MMKIGILQCDDVRSSLSPDFGEYSDMIAERLFLQNETFEFHTYQAHHGILPECVEECDAYILTGSRYSVFDSDVLWINGLMNFVVRLNKAQIKTIGICFGHQIIAEAMGGKVERADCGWVIGVHEATIKQQRSFMQPSKESFHIAMMCEDQVQKIGEEAIILASGPQCEYAMLQYGEHILSVQGHPEFSPDFAKSLLNIRQGELPSKRYERGSKSFSEHSLDSDLVFSWFAHFLADNASSDASDKNV